MKYSNKISFRIDSGVFLNLQIKNIQAVLFSRSTIAISEIFDNSNQFNSNINIFD